jgi:hypothetical protein
MKLVKAFIVALVEWQASLFAFVFAYFFAYGVASEMDSSIVAPLSNIFGPPVETTGLFDNLILIICFFILLAFSAFILFLILKLIDVYWLGESEDGKRKYLTVAMIISLGIAALFILTGDPFAVILNMPITLLILIYNVIYENRRFKELERKKLLTQFIDVTQGKINQ